MGLNLYNEYTEKHIINNSNFKYTLELRISTRGIKEHSYRLNELLIFFSQLSLQESFVNKIKFYKKISKTKKGKLKRSEILFNLITVNKFETLNTFFSNKNFLDLLKLFLVDKIPIDVKFSNKEFILIFIYNNSVFNSTIATKKNILVDQDLITLKFKLKDTNQCSSYFFSYYLLNLFNFYEYNKDNKEI